MSGNRIFYSFPKSKKNFALEKNQVIGPGAYSPKTHTNKPTDPQWSFPKENRDKILKNELPGPGTYEQKQKYQQSLGKFGKDGKNQNLKNDMPGPGNYNDKSIFEENLKKMKGTSMFKKYNSKQNNQQPGPQDYDQSDLFKENIKNKKGISFGKEQKENDLQLKKEKQKPGPGNYEVNNSQMKKTGGKFGKNPKNNLKFNEVPGPGQYECPQKIGNENSKYSIRPKYKQDQCLTKSEVPGPGQYNGQFEILKPKQTQWSFGKQRRVQSSKPSFQTGPGSYQYHIPKSTKLGKFGTSKRDQNKTNEIPGPGNYNVNKSTLETNQNFGNFFKSKHFRSKHKNQDPVGPGSYNDKIEFIKQRPQSCKFGTQKKLQQKYNEGAEPGSYNPKYEFLKKKNPQIKFGTFNNRDLIQFKLVPGPGQYNLRSKPYPCQNMPIGGKYQQVDKNNIPGPGSYQPKNNFSSNKPNTNILGKFGKDKKDVDFKNLTPGPDQYFQDPRQLNLTQNKGKGIKIGTEQRDKNINDKNPGPGTYNYQDDIQIAQKTGKGFSMQKKYKQNLKDNFPGPGNYKTLFELSKDQNMTSQYKKTRNNYIGKEQRFKSKENNPTGPGQYQDKTIFYNKPRGQKNFIQRKNIRYSRTWLIQYKIKIQ